MLDVTRVSKRFGERQALAKVSFRVEAGEVFGFVGSNGAGKTTTMRIVLGVLTADAGEVRWQDRPVDAELRRRIGYMPEQPGMPLVKQRSKPGQASRRAVGRSPGQRRDQVG